MDEIKIQKNIPVKYDVDVFVAGGGPAGVAAAVSAARNGASVYVAESFSAFGGSAVSMLVPAFMQFTNGKEFLSAGIGSEIFKAIKERSYESFRKYCPNGIPVETLKCIYGDMVINSGAKFSFFTHVIDVITENKTVQAVICSAKGSIFAVKAKVYIDCTGETVILHIIAALNIITETKTERSWRQPSAESGQV